jgi:Icc-related predicted phosphoesterase
MLSKLEEAIKENLKTFEKSLRKINSFYPPESYEMDRAFTNGVIAAYEDVLKLIEQEKKNAS